MLVMAKWGWGLDGREGDSMSQGLLVESKSPQTELLGTLEAKNTIKRSQINSFSWICLIDQVWFDDIRLYN